jgi:hypothetical protein
MLEYSDKLRDLTTAVWKGLTKVAVDLDSRDVVTFSPTILVIEGLGGRRDVTGVEFVRDRRSLGKLATTVKPIDINGHAGVRGGLIFSPSGQSYGIDATLKAFLSPDAVEPCDGRFRLLANKAAEVMLARERHDGLELALAAIDFRT